MPNTILSFKYLIYREHRLGRAAHTDHIGSGLEMPVEMPEFAMWYHTDP